MNEKPSILIEFDPDTWIITAIYFKTSTDEQTEQLKKFLELGQKNREGHYDA